MLSTAITAVTAVILLTEERSKMNNGFMVDWKLVGARLAVVSDDEQSEFFKSFCKEIFTWPTCYEREMQLLSVNKKLTENERELLGCLSHESKL